MYAYVGPGGPTLPDVITHADRHGFAITDVAVKETTLETVFINLTGKGAPGMTATTADRPRNVRSRASARHAFVALLLRDLAVLGKESRMFIGRTIMQPLLLIFVFTYVFPKIGQGIGGERGAAEFSTLLVGGAIASAMIFQGVQAVALPLVQDFGYTREIEDRVLAPMPVWAVAAEKVASGRDPGAASRRSWCSRSRRSIPATPVHLPVHWLLPRHAVAACGDHERRRSG